MGIVQVNQDRRMAVFEDAYSMWTERRGRRPDDVADPLQAKAAKGPDPD